MIQNARSRNALTLYTRADAVQDHRVRLVLAAKGVAHERLLVDPQRPPADLADVNPYNDTPTLADRDISLYEPGVICEYLDERYPHPALMPVDPLSRARLRLAMVRVQREWLPQVEAIGGGGRAADAARKQLREALLSALPLFKAARFFLNDELSQADCLVLPVIWRLDALGVDLGKSGQPVLEYAERLFRSAGYQQSLTADERALRPSLRGV